MMRLLVKLLVKDADAVEKDEVRKAYGNLASMTGIVANLLLCLFKFMAGTIANSISITADAVNNLSDAGSSIVSLVSFHLAGKPADAKHPFGHARYECLASLLVAVLILFLGVELAKESVSKILDPQEVVFSWTAVIVLGISILVKLWMYAYNRHYGALIHSSVMEATAADSLSDVLGTGGVLLSTIISPLIHFNLDGYMGVLVAAFILFTGISLIRSALDELLGKAPGPDIVKEIIARIRKYDGVLGVHDLIVHDYGPNRLFVSVHVEVDYRRDIFESHDMIDNIEKEIKEEMGIETVVHMDPIRTDDELTNALREMLRKVLKQIDPVLSFHDFRVVPGTTHTNLIFDVVVPFDSAYDDETLMKLITDGIHTYRKDCYAVITFDRAYTSEEKREED